MLIERKKHEGKVHFKYCIKFEKDYSIKLLNLLVEFILDCQKINKLDDYMTINELGGFGKVITMNYNENKTAQDSFSIIVNLLNKLAIEIKKESNYKDNKNYIQIKKELDLFKKRLNEINDITITGNEINHIDEILKSLDY